MGGEARAVIRLATWLERQREPIEERIYETLCDIARDPDDPRAAVRAAAIVLDRIDPAPKQQILVDARRIVAVSLIGADAGAGGGDADAALPINGVALRAGDGEGPHARGSGSA